jgi:hypothetical protein
MARHKVFHRIGNGFADLVGPRRIARHAKSARLLVLKRLHELRDKGRRVGDGRASC